MNLQPQMSTEEVAEYADYNGLGFSVHRGLWPESIKDVHLRDLWQEASEILREIEEILNE